MTPTEVHEIAVKNFIRLNLSYRFTATLLTDATDNKKPVVVRFLFSKPTQRKPEPEITVYMDLQVEEQKGDTWKYALFMEGQKYKRVITIDSDNVTGSEFNEHLVDKVFAQKEVVRQQQRWVPAA